MQVIEDVEESLLGGFGYELLDIIDDKHINTLIESDEVVDGVAADGVGVLHLEQVGRDIQHALLGV